MRKLCVNMRKGTMKIDMQPFLPCLDSQRRVLSLLVCKPYLRFDSTFNR